MEIKGGHILLTREEYAELLAANAKLAARVKELESMLIKDSSNSHKPPLSDGYRKGIKNNREKRGKSQGAQKGHKGKTLQMISNPDKVVIQEYYNVATLKFGLDKLLVKSTIESFNPFEIITIQPSIIYNAIDIKILNHLSFRDSLIISAAKSANCSMVLTEDMNDGRVIDRIKIQSPFTVNLS